MWSTCFMGRHCGWTCELSKRPSNICCIFGAGQNGTFLPFDILQQASTHLHGRSKYLSGVAVDWYSINIVFWNIFFFTKLAVTEGQGQIICSQKVGWVRDDSDLSYLRSPEVLTDKVTIIKAEIRPQEDDNDWAKVFKSGIVHQGSGPTLAYLSAVTRASHYQEILTDSHYQDWKPAARSMIWYEIQAALSLLSTRQTWCNLWSLYNTR